jgi:hypothetical protein
VLGFLDRSFFKASKSFSSRFLYTCLPNNPKWDIPPPSQEEREELRALCTQKFYYLGKGAHCYAFLSADRNYVIKFHRYASHMRIFPWLTHPFSYQFNERRKKIKKHNFEILDYNLSNYKTSFEDLKEESGLLFVHINKTDYLKQSVTIVDKIQGEHVIPLDQTTFVVQRCAELPYDALNRYSALHDLDGAKRVVSQIIHLIVDCCNKGYVDQDPVLHKNYGVLASRAIHIDIGDLVHDETFKERSLQADYVSQITDCLRQRLERDYPELVTHYHQEIEKLRTP